MRNLLLTSGLITLGAMSSAWGVLSITFDFSNFGTGGAWSSLHNDAWNGSTSDAVKQTAAENVMQAAADYWETAFASSTRSVSQTIEVSWASHGGFTLAYGGVSWGGPSNYNVSGGSLSWDNDGSSTFFVDLTPSNNSEYGDSSFRTADLGGGTINVERIYYDAASGTAARDNIDLLSIAIHEIGHTLGMVSGYPRFTALDSGNDGDIDLPGGTQLTYNGGHLDYDPGVPENPGFPAAGYSIGGSPYYPLAMGGVIYDGTRKLLTEADILAFSAMQNLNNPNTNPLIPELSPTLVLLFAIGLMLIFRRRGDVKRAG